MEMRHFFEMPPVSHAQSKLFINKKWYKNHVKKKQNEDHGDQLANVHYIDLQPTFFLMLLNS